MNTHTKKFGATLTAVLLLAVFFTTLLPLTAFADTHIDHDVQTNDADNMIVDQNVTVGENNGKVVETKGQAGGRHGRRQRQRRNG